MNDLIIVPIFIKNFQ